jgi:FAD/FMN-containing dehydrogenase
VMISLADMKDVAVGSARATAAAQGGVSWAELNTATSTHGLAVTGGAISTTGIAGLTLGGGLGWLMAKHGLAADNLLAVELVTAAGEVLDVDAVSHPDLFWALRGGGGNFGVVTSFTYRLHPVGMVTGGLIAHPIEAAPELLRFYRDAVADVSDDLTVFAGLVHAPDGSGAKLAALVVCHAGDPDAAERGVELSGQRTAEDLRDDVRIGGARRVGEQAGVVGLRRCRVSTPRRSPSRIAISVVCSPCSNGNPMPRSVARHSAATSSAPRTCSPPSDASADTPRHYSAALPSPAVAARTRGPVNHERGHLRSIKEPSSGSCA